jgi:prevent-host-death family protein
MIEVPISQFKAKCLALLEQVRTTREPIRVTRHGKPIAEVVPPTLAVDRSKWIGSLKGTVEILGDIISPATDKDESKAERD